MIEEVFNLFDTDGQQQLDEEELACAICAMGFCQTGYAEVLLSFLSWSMQADAWFSLYSYDLCMNNLSL